MRMHEFFVGLKPVMPLAGVSGVSGGAVSRKHAESQDAAGITSHNTGCNTDPASGVWQRVAAETEAHPGATSYETPATPETRSAEMDAADWRDVFEERAAIMEFDGGLSRADAERAAHEFIQQQMREENCYAQDQTLH